MCENAFPRYRVFFVVFFCNGKFFPSHNKKKNYKKNPNPNLPEGSKIQVWNFTHELNLMKVNILWKRTFDRRRCLMDDNPLWKMTCN